MHTFVYGFGVLACVAEQQREVVGRSKSVDVPFAEQALPDGQRVTQQRLRLGILALVLHGFCEAADRAQGVFMHVSAAGSLCVYFYAHGRTTRAPAPCTAGESRLLRGKAKISTPNAVSFG